MPNKTVEESIRSYLEFLAVPASRRGVDREAVAALKEQIKNATDPIARLDLAVALEQAQDPASKQAPGEDVFVSHGKAWAAEHGYTAAMLRRHANVPARVLQDAGIETPTEGARRSAKGTRHRWAPGELEGIIATRMGPGEWTLKDLVEEAGHNIASPKIQALVAANVVQQVKAGGKGQGNAAIYRRGPKAG